MLNRSLKYDIQQEMNYHTLRENAKIRPIVLSPFYLTYQTEDPKQNSTSTLNAFAPVLYFQLLGLLNANVKIPYMILFSPESQLYGEMHDINCSQSSDLVKNTARREIKIGLMNLRLDLHSISCNQKLKEAQRKPLGLEILTMKPIAFVCFTSYNGHTQNNFLALHNKARLYGPNPWLFQNKRNNSIDKSYLLLTYIINNKAFAKLLINNFTLAQHSIIYVLWQKDIHINGSIDAEFELAKDELIAKNIRIKSALLKNNGTITKIENLFIEKLIINFETQKISLSQIYSQQYINYTERESEIHMKIKPLFEKILNNQEKEEDLQNKFNLLDKDKNETLQEKLAVYKQRNTFSRNFAFLAYMSSTSAIVVHGYKHKIKHKSTLCIPLILLFNAMYCQYNYHRQLHKLALKTHYYYHQSEQLKNLPKLEAKR